MTRRRVVDGNAKINAPVTFRVTHDEYECLKKLAAEKTNNNVGNLIRIALNTLVGEDKFRLTEIGRSKFTLLTQENEDLKKRIDELERRLKDE